MIDFCFFLNYKLQDLLFFKTITDFIEFFILNLTKVKIVEPSEMWVHIKDAERLVVKDAPRNLWLFKRER